jgi:hypothetical protein
MPARCELAKIKDGERGEFELERGEANEET